MLFKYFKQEEVSIGQRALACTAQKHSYRFATLHGPLLVEKNRFEAIGMVWQCLS